MARSAGNPTVLFGTEQGDMTWYPPGDFVIFAGSGNDSLVIGDGASLVDGGAGDDVFYCTAGTQVLMGGDGQDAFWAGVGAQTVLGGAGDDVISGQSGPQLLAGGDGDDGIVTGAGNQTVLGGTGDDTILTSNTTPWFLEPSRHLVFGEDGNDTIISPDRAINAVPQFLDSGAGNDLFCAGHMDATLTGGSGRDTFAFFADAERQFVITDFQAGQDIIQFRAAFNMPSSCWSWQMPQPVPPPALTVSAAPGPDGDAVLHFGYGATATLLHVPAERVAAHLGDYVKPG